MEYIEGKNLMAFLKENRLSKEKGIKPEKVLDIAKQVCLSLKEAHNNNIIHRDIKPANILIKDNGQVVVIDFGISVTTDLRRSDTCTLEYSAPEQVSSGAVKKSDLYSLGSMMYELIVGSRWNEKEGRFAGAFGRVPNYEKLDEFCKESELSRLSDLIKRLLENNYNCRPDISEAISSLERISETTTVPYGTVLIDDNQDIDSTDKSIDDGRDDDVSVSFYLRKAYIKAAIAMFFAVILFLSVRMLFFDVYTVGSSVFNVSMIDGLKNSQKNDRRVIKLVNCILQNKGREYKVKLESDGYNQIVDKILSKKVILGLVPRFTYIFRKEEILKNCTVLGQKINVNKIFYESVFAFNKQSNYVDFPGKIKWDSIGSNEGNFRVLLGKTLISTSSSVVPEVVLSSYGINIRSSGISFDRMSRADMENEFNNRGANSIMATLSDEDIKNFAIINNLEVIHTGVLIPYDPIISCSYDDNDDKKKAIDEIMDVLVLLGAAVKNQRISYPGFNEFLFNPVIYFDIFDEKWKFITAPKWRDSNKWQKAGKIKVNDVFEVRMISFSRSGNLTKTLTLDDAKIRVRSASTHKCTEEAGKDCSILYGEIDWINTQGGSFRQGSNICTPPVFCRMTQ